MTPRGVLGIDPGLDGALALYGPFSLLRLEDIPTLQLKTKRIVDETALARMIDSWSADIGEVWLEVINAMPSVAGPNGVRRTMGAQSAFNFGLTYGLIRGVCAANFLPIVDVTPSSWKAALKVRGDKDESRQRASAILPQNAGLWPLKKHHGRAEAALIAWHGFHTSTRMKGAA